MAACNGGQNAAAATHLALVKVSNLFFVIIFSNIVIHITSSAPPRLGGLQQEKVKVKVKVKWTLPQI